mgnify:CR=1 FL=1
MSIKFVKTIFNDSGLTYIWQSQFFNGSKPNNISMFLSRIETTLLSQFRQKWQSDVNTSSKWFYYRMYKTDHKFEKYVDIMDG